MTLSAAIPPVYANGARVSWLGIPATVISGNEPDEWTTGYPYISLLLDRPVARGTGPYAEVLSTDVIAL